MNRQQWLELRKKGIAPSDVPTVQIHHNDFNDVIQIGDRYTPVDDAVQSLQARGWQCIKTGINSAGNTVEIWRKGQNENSKAR